MSRRGEFAAFLPGEDGEPLFMVFPDHVAPTDLTPALIDRYLSGTRAYAERKAQAAGFATPDQIAARVAFYGARCWLCAAPYQALDHVKPLSRGGANWPANLRPICKSCNSRKCARWPVAGVRA